jgi:integrase
VSGDRNAARDVRLPYHLYSLRHFAATQAIAAGFDPVSVANRLGHADPSVTLRVYSHAIDARDREMVLPG